MEGERKKNHKVRGMAKKKKKKCNKDCKTNVNQKKFRHLLLFIDKKNLASFKSISSKIIRLELKDVVFFNVIPNDCCLTNCLSIPSLKGQIHEMSSGYSIPLSRHANPFQTFI